MKSIERLIDYLKHDETVKQYQELERIIFDNPQYKAAYTALTTKQKAYVRARESGAKDAKEKKDAYEAYRKSITSDPIVHQYLTLQADVNAMIQTIAGILESALNAPFTDK